MPKKPTLITVARGAERCQIVVSLVQDILRNKIALPSVFRLAGGSAVLNIAFTGQPPPACSRRLAQTQPVGPRTEGPSNG
jgi:hypothetical protein